MALLRTWSPVTKSPLPLPQRGGSYSSHAAGELSFGPSDNVLPAGATIGKKKR